MFHTRNGESDLCESVEQHASCVRYRGVLLPKVTEVIIPFSLPGKTYVGSKNYRPDKNLKLLTLHSYLGNIFN